MRRIKLLVLFLVLSGMTALNTAAAKAEPQPLSVAEMSNVVGAYPTWCNQSANCAVPCAPVGTSSTEVKPITYWICVDVPAIWRPFYFRSKCPDATHPIAARPCGMKWVYTNDPSCDPDFGVAVPPALTAPGCA